MCEYIIEESFYEYVMLCMEKIVCELKKCYLIVFLLGFVCDVLYGFVVF